MRFAKRIEKLPPYLFAEIDKKIAQKREEGVDVISLGMGDPDKATPSNIVEKMCEEARNPANHRYPSYYGHPEFRKAIAEWYESRFGVALDPDTEVLPLIGSKEGLAHICFAIVDPGEVVLVPDPGYPVYNTGTILAGGTPHLMPLLEVNKYLPDLEAIGAETAKACKMMFLSYPNNPTAATADAAFFKKVVDFARRHQIIVCHDNPYSEITFDSYVAPSFLEAEGSREVGVEFHSLSKTYNMTGWRIGFVVGNRAVIEALGRVKTNIDSGIFNAIQKAGIEALRGPQEAVREICGLYQRRRDLVIDRLNQMGWNLPKTKASIYIWVPVPKGHTSATFATFVLNEAGVVLSPGSAYGPSGEGYVRISLTIEDDRLAEALKRIEKVLK